MTWATAVQCRWLGWDPTLEPRLRQWIDDNRAASRSGLQAHTAAVAEEFDDIIRSELRRRRSEPPQDDVTSRLIHDESLGRPLQDEELVAVLRNWTAGDLSSLGLCVGVVVQFLATHQVGLVQF